MEKMVEHTSAGGHAAGGDDDLREMRVVDLLRIFLLGIEEVVLPLQRGTVFLNQRLRFFGVLLGVLEKNLDGFDGHGAVEVDGHTRDLDGFHQIFEHEEEFLGALNGESWNNSGSTARDCVFYCFREFR